MRARSAALLLAAIMTGFASGAAATTLPIYIEDNHAGTFYWLAQQLDLDEACTLIHFDAHSDASGIFDSDKIRGALRTVASADERQELLQKWRKQGAIQCFNWIEPLMPAPVGRVIWVAGDAKEQSPPGARVAQAAALLDGHLEAAPRQSGSFRGRYRVCNLDHLREEIRKDDPLIITIDLDYFTSFPSSDQPAAFQRIWNFVLQQENLRAITFAISRPYLKDDEEADRLLFMALNAARLLPTARIYFEPFAVVGHDHSRRARELMAAGEPVPDYDLSRASETLKSLILAEPARWIVRQDRSRWISFLQKWATETAQIHLEIKDAQPSTDGIWRIPLDTSAVAEVVANPWTAKLSRVQWFALEPAHPSCNVSALNSEQAGFVARSAPYPQWNERELTNATEVALPIKKLDALFEAKSHCGSVRLRARAVIDDKVRETPVMEVRRSPGWGFRAAIMEQFGLPYLFGSGALKNQGETGAETNLGTDCANFVVYALRRQGLRVPWSDPKQLRPHLQLAASLIRSGAAHFSEEELQSGLIVHLGTHVAAVMEDHPPLGILDDGDLMAHQLKGIPETLTLGDLLRTQHVNRFDLYRVPASNFSATLTFGGDLMLGRSCAVKIQNGIDPFAGIREALSRSSFAAANLECTLSRTALVSFGKGYSFTAPAKSAELLHNAGFRAVSLANNHALDFGEDALKNCAEILSQKKIETVGAAAAPAENPYAPKFFVLSNGVTIALLAVNDLPVGRDSVEPTNSSIAQSSDQACLSRAITAVRAQANFIACMVHWGIENTGIVTDEQRALARWLIDQGTDLVVGSHPHCVQPLDFYRGRPIAYSLGNLVFDGGSTLSDWNRGALLQVKLSDDGRVKSAGLIPVILEDGLPRLLQPAHGALAAE